MKRPDKKIYENLRRQAGVSCVTTDSIPHPRGCSQGSKQERGFNSQGCPSCMLLGPTQVTGWRRAAQQRPCALSHGPASRWR